MKISTGLPNIITKRLNKLKVALLGAVFVFASVAGGLFYASQTARAVGPSSIVIGDIIYNTNQNQSGTGWNYDLASNTLTLNGYSSDKSFIVGGGGAGSEINIHLQGKSAISGPNAGFEVNTIYATITGDKINNYQGTLEVKRTGSLQRVTRFTNLTIKSGILSVNNTLATGETTENESSLVRVAHRLEISGSGGLIVNAQLTGQYSSALHVPMSGPPAGTPSHKFSTSDIVKVEVTAPGVTDESVLKSISAVSMDRTNVGPIEVGGTGSYIFRAPRDHGYFSFRANAGITDPLYYIRTPEDTSKPSQLVDMYNKPVDPPLVQLSGKYVYPGPLKNISVKTPPTDVTYDDGDALDLSGLVVTLTKSDDTTEDIALANFADKGLEVSPANGATLTPANKKLTIKNLASGKTVDQPITVTGTGTYTVSTICGENGTCMLNPNKASYNAGEDLFTQAEANTGYVIDEYKINGEVDYLATDQTSYSQQISGITANHTFEVTFKPAPASTYTINFSECDANKGTCTVDPEASNYTNGAKVDLSVEPSTGYEINSITINGVAEMVTNPAGWGKTIFADANKDIKVAFRSAASVQHTLTMNCGNPGEGVCTPGTGQYGETHALPYSITANPGYVIDTLDDGGGPTPAYSGASQMSGALDFDVDRTMTVTFKVKNAATTYSIYAEGPSNGSLLVDGDVFSTALAGATVTPTITPDAGYKLKRSYYITMSDDAEHNFTTSFVMPADAVTIMAEFTPNIPVYRFWSNTQKAHFYTMGEAEKNLIIKTYPVNVWKYEGIAYYVSE